jgi:hypothetical protein
MTLTQAHQFRTRGFIHLKRRPADYPGSVPQGGGAIQQRGVKGQGRKLSSAARERAALNQDLDRRGSSGGGGQAMSEAGSDTRRALSLATKRRRKS